MLPRIARLSLLLVLLTFSAEPAAGFSWPWRWTARPKTPPSQSTPDVNPVSPGNSVPPPAAWPPHGRDSGSQPKQPRSPAPSGFGALVPEQRVPSFRPTSQPTVGNWAKSTPDPAWARISPVVELGRPVALPESASAETMGTLPAVMPAPRVTTNPTLAPLP